MSKANSHNTPQKHSNSKKLLLLFVLVLFIAAAGFGVWWFIFRDPKNKLGGFGQGENLQEKYYSNLTGLEIANESLNTSPTFCVQVPNGSTDGARPQVGLSHAAVVFEAIAEAGITRFAAIYQNPDTGIIGPIRSLRPYYLEWDTPFDCTIVHDGGSNEALVAIQQGQHRNLDEDFRYMWKVNDPARYWNNVFTSPAKLLEFNDTNNYKTSQPQTFPHLTPSELENILNPSTCEDENCDDSTIESEPNTPELANYVAISFGNLTDFNTYYHYDSVTNTYQRFYATDKAHQVYDCQNSDQNISDCPQTQIAPSTIIAMMVQENLMSDNYHENIKTIGHGKAYIFQNGQVIKANWKKSSAKSQITFQDENNQEVKLTPGQTWIAAVPQYGNVEWEELVK